MISLIKNLLARGNDENAWVQIIVIAAIIGFGILKKIVSEAKTATQQKSQQNDEEEYQPQELNKTSDTDDDYKTLEQIRQEKIAQIRAAFGIPEPPKQAIPRQMQKRPMPVHRPMVKKTPPPPKTEPEYIKPEPKAHPAYRQDKKHITPPAETEDILIKLSSPQDLRSAILYQEILGPPVALR